MAPDVTGVNRFLPPEAVQWLEPGDRPPYGRTRAVQTLLAAHRARPRVLLGLGLWLGAAGGVAATLVGIILAVDGINLSDPPLALVGALLLTAGAAAATVSARLGVDLLRAGRALTRGMVAWIGDEGRPRDLAEMLVARRAVYRGPIFVRLVFCSLALLGAVLCFSAVGFTLAELFGEAPRDRLLLVLVGATAAVFTVLCAVPGVALARASHRLQKVVVWQFARGL